MDLDKDERLDRKQKRFSLKFLEFLLCHNYIWYESIFYNQSNRVAMGAKFVPIIANVYMAKLGGGFILKDRPPQHKL